jgi:hypothetical protein
MPGLLQLISGFGESQQRRDCPAVSAPPLQDRKPEALEQDRQRGNGRNK